METPMGTVPDYIFELESDREKVSEYVGFVGDCTAEDIERDLDIPLSEAIELLAELTEGEE